MSCPTSGLEAWKQRSGFILLSFKSRTALSVIYFAPIESFFTERDKDNILLASQYLRIQRMMLVLVNILPPACHKVQVARYGSKEGNVPISQESNKEEMQKPMES